VSGQLKKEFAAEAIFVSSPAVRAFSTALVFSAAYQVQGDSILLDNRLYDSEVADYFEVIRELPSSMSSAFIFGHNDVISETAFKLLKDPSVESLRTCGVVWIGSEALTWKDFVSTPCTCELQLYPALIKEV
jgi:phosphohistidine phosphatase